MNILAIDTSNELLGVAIVKDGIHVAEKMTYIKKGQTERLMPAIVHLMNRVELEPEQLDQIVVARGPGSYTGVRIGVTTAKTMAWGLDIPIYAISSLQTLAYNGALFNGYIWSFFDARRDHIYTGLYEVKDGKLLEVIEEQHVAFDEWIEQLPSFNRPIVCLSPDLSTFNAKIKQSLSEQILFPSLSDHFARPSNLIHLSSQKDAIPVHLVKPNYLRITEAEANYIKEQKKRGNEDGA